MTQLLQNFITLLRHRGVELTLKETAEFERIVADSGLSGKTHVADNEIELLAKQLAQHHLKRQPVKVKRSASMIRLLAERLANQVRKTGNSRSKRSISMSIHNELQAKFPGAAMCPNSQLTVPLGEMMTKFCTHLMCRVKFRKFLQDQHGEGNVETYTPEEQKECEQLVEKRERHHEITQNIWKNMETHMDTIDVMLGKLHNIADETPDKSEAKKALEDLERVSKENDQHRKNTVGWIVAAGLVIIFCCVFWAVKLWRYSRRLTRQQEHANFA